jgi:ATP-dependent Clp protease protease subunit
MNTENKWFAMSRPNNEAGEPAKSAEISIYDQIGGFGVSANEFIDELKSLDGVDRIDLRIASGGGSIVEGNTIFNALKRHQAKVVTHIDSLAASMASVIAMAGDEIHMAENALLMIHNPWTMSMGGAEQLRKDADLLDKMEANIRSSYSRSNKTPEEIDALMEAETYFTAEEALEAGFIDSIEEANLAAASITDMENGKNVPQAKLDAIQIECQKKQIEKFQSQVSDLFERVSQLVEKNEKLEINVGALNQARANLLETHEADLAAAKEQTRQAITAKAAELLAESGTPAVAVEPSQEANAQQMTEEQFWSAYNEFTKRGDFEGKNEFYAEHKHVIGQ